MSKKLKSLFVAIFSVFFVLSGQALAETVNIVSDTAYAPFEFKDSDQTYKGIDVDLITEVAKRQKWDLKMTYPGFDAAVNAVQAGQADGLMAGTTVTEARKKVFTFSDTYYDTAIVLYTKKDNNISHYDQLKGKTVGVKNGTAAQAFLDKHKDKYGYTVKTYDTSDLMNNSLDTGAVDAAMDDEPVVKYAIGQGKDYAINMAGEKVGSFAFAVKKGSKHEHLVEDFNQALAAMKADGTYEQIMDKWLKEDSKTDKASQLQSTGDASLKASPQKDTYVIASDVSFPPFEYLDDQGKYTGFDMDLIRSIATQQGFNLTINNVGFDAALNTVQSGQVDGVIAGMTITDDRKNVFDFSDPYYTTNIILAIKKGTDIASYEDLKGKTVAAKNGTSSYDFLAAHVDQYGYHLKPFEDGPSMYDSLNSGSVDALMDDEPVLAYAISQGRQFETPIAGESAGQVGFAVKKGSNPELIEMFNNGLAALKENGKYDELVQHYLATNDHGQSSDDIDETTIFGLLKNNYRQLLSGLGTTLSLTLVSFAIAMVVGIIFGMMAVAPSSILRTISRIFVDVVRGIPLMIVAAFIFWGIPNLIESTTGQQSPINDFVAATIALSLNGAAYIAEIVRGGIEAVAKGQMEASRSLGVSYGTTMRKIILPQAVRLMVPNFVNQFVISLKDTTIVSAIGLIELFQTGRIIIARNYQSFRMYAILAVIYLIMITLLTRLAKRLEKRMN